MSKKEDKATGFGGIGAPSPTDKPEQDSGSKDKD